MLTGTDSSIGNAVVLLFAEEGADIAIIYHHEDQDAEKTKNEIVALGRRCIIFPGDINHYEFCEGTAKKVMAKFGRINVLVNNAGVQVPFDNIENLDEKNIRKTFVLILSE